jgi:hypothetical protein
MGWIWVGRRARADLAQAAEEGPEERPHHLCTTM